METWLLRPPPLQAAPAPDALLRARVLSLCSVVRVVEKNRFSCGSVSEAMKWWYSCLNTSTLSCTHMQTADEHNHTGHWAPLWLSLPRSSLLSTCFLRYSCFSCCPSSLAQWLKGTDTTSQPCMPSRVLRRWVDASCTCGGLAAGRGRIEAWGRQGFSRTQQNLGRRCRAEQPTIQAALHMHADGKHPRAVRQSASPKLPASRCACNQLTSKVLWTIHLHRQPHVALPLDCSKGGKHKQPRSADAVCNSALQVLLAPGFEPSAEACKHSTAQHS